MFVFLFYFLVRTSIQDGKPIEKYFTESTHWNILTWVHYYAARFTYLKDALPDEKGLKVS